MQALQPKALFCRCSTGTPSFLLSCTETSPNLFMFPSHIAVTWKEPGWRPGLPGARPGEWQGTGQAAAILGELPVSDQVPDESQGFHPSRGIERSLLRRRQASTCVQPLPVHPRCWGAQARLLLRTFPCCKQEARVCGVRNAIGRSLVLRKFPHAPGRTTALAYRPPMGPRLMRDWGAAKLVSRPPHIGVTSGAAPAATAENTFWKLGSKSCFTGFESGFDTASGRLSPYPTPHCLAPPTPPAGRSASAAKPFSFQLGPRVLILQVTVLHIA